MSDNFGTGSAAGQVPVHDKHGNPSQPEPVPKKVPKKRVDLHMHSRHSDGTLTPEELVARAKSKGLSCIALTDHDTASGIRSAQNAGRREGVEIIPGIEISVIFEPGTMHILGYFVDPENQDLLEGLRPIQEARQKRNPMIIERLRTLGMEITLEEVENVSGGGQVGRPHFARVMVEKGYVKNFEEAFNKYLTRGGPAYIDKRTVASADAIAMIRRSGGAAVLAHPKQLKVPHGKTFESEIAKLADQGLAGLEVYSSCQSLEEASYYKEVANRFDLVVTGGSDFHGGNKAAVELGWMGEGVNLFYDTVEELKSRRR